MDDSVVKCPKCGHDNDASSEECEKCGVTLALVLRGMKKTKPQAEKKVPKGPEPTPLQKCPKCGHAVADGAVECIKCGIIFSKYFEVQERILKESQDNLEVPPEELKKQAEPPKEATQPDETAERAEAEAKKQEAARREKEKARIEAQKAERLKKQQEEAARDASRKKAEAEEKPPLETPPEVTGGEEHKRIAQLEAEAENLRAKSQALINEKQAREKADIVQKSQQEQERQDILQQAQDARNKISALEKEADALKQDAAAARQETEALKKEKEALEAAENRRLEQEQQAADALQKEREDARQRTQTILETVQPKPTMKELLKKYEGEAIGINVDDPAEIKNAILAKVNEDHFSIMVPENELVHSYPYSHIVSIVEGVKGVPLDASEEAPQFPVVIKVFHLMVKKKWGFI